VRFGRSFLEILLTFSGHITSNALPNEHHASVIVYGANQLRNVYRVSRMVLNHDRLPYKVIVHEYERGVTMYHLHIDRAS
jgi:hypothetical protein